jgi:hypothetical protein
MTADIDLINDPIECVLLCDGSYSVDITADEFFSEIPVDEIVSKTLITGKTISGRRSFDADDLVFPSVSGQTVTQLVILKSTGIADSSPLIVYYDDVVGFPLTPNGGDIIVTWSDGPERIFKL